MPQTTQLVSVGVKIKRRQSGYRFCFLLLLPQSISYGHRFALQVTSTLRRDRKHFQKQLVNNQSLKCHREGNSEKNNVLQILLMLLGPHGLTQETTREGMEATCSSTFDWPQCGRCCWPLCFVWMSYHCYGPMNQHRQLSHVDRRIAIVTMQRVNGSSNYSKIFPILYKLVFKMRYFNCL